jgi:hypothetical protein
MKKVYFLFYVLYGHTVRKNSNGLIVNTIDLILIDEASMVGGVGWCGHDYSRISVVISDDIKYVYFHNKNDCVST